MAGGRPTRYNKQFHPALARALAQTGRTDEEIAKELGIATATFYNWRNKHQEFVEALESGKEGPDDLVEKSLFLSKRGISSSGFSNISLH